ncbi:hypothetical protein FRX31_007828, partial [Thalictrum thalictroides]
MARKKEAGRGKEEDDHGRGCTVRRSDMLTTDVASRGLLEGFQEINRGVEEEMINAVQVNTTPIKDNGNVVEDLMDLSSKKTGVVTDLVEVGSCYGVKDMEISPLTKSNLKSSAQTIPSEQAQQTQSVNMSDIPSPPVRGRKDMAVEDQVQVNQDRVDYLVELLKGFQKRQITKTQEEFIAKEMDWLRAKQFSFGDSLLISGTQPHEVFDDDYAIFFIACDALSEEESKSSYYEGRKTEMDMQKRGTDKSESSTTESGESSSSNSGSGNVKKYERK